MVVALDSSVILDVLLDNQFADQSEHAITTLSNRGQLIICDTVFTEIYPVIREAWQDFVTDWNLQIVSNDFDSSLVAAKWFADYLNRTSERKRVVADFLIAGHAKVFADVFLTRDKGFNKDYFSELHTVFPEDFL